MKKTSTFGIIHIGSIHTSMAIVKYHSPTQIEVIDSANKELPLGEEVFRTHRLSSHPSMSSAISSRDSGSSS